MLYISCFTIYASSQQIDLAARAFDQEVALAVGDGDSEHAGLADRDGRSRDDEPIAVDQQGLNPATINLIVRYNDKAADTFFPGASALELLAYNGSWNLTQNAWLDTTNNLIGGQVQGGLDFIAVGVPWNIASTDQSPTPPIAATTPEPTLLLPCLAATMLLRRRRRAVNP